jgi:phosphoribosyl-AMP cyclohydrolase
MPVQARSLQAGGGTMTGEQFESLSRRISWNDAGLVPVVAQDSETGAVLMMAWMSAESLRMTIEGGRAVYFSRSRKELWRKGDGSGHIQEVVSLQADCDADCLLLKVRQTGPACHTGQRSCFYRVIDKEGAFTI